MAILPDITNDAYHAASNVSHSKLRVFAEKGPGYYHAQYIAKTLAREETKALLFGQAYEILYQQGGDTFKERVCVLPEGHGNLKTVQAAKAAALAAGKIPISPSEYQDALEMMRSLSEQDTAPAMIEASEQQLTLTAEAYGLTIQSRPDWLMRASAFSDGAASTDLKTCKTLDDMSDTGIVKMGYHTQAALVRRLCRMNDLGDCTCFLLAVEKEPVYRCELIKLSPDLLAQGDRWLDVYLPKLAECYQTDRWPRARPGVRVAGVPRWLRDEAA